MPIRQQADVLVVPEGVARGVLALQLHQPRVVLVAVGGPHAFLAPPAGQPSGPDVNWRASALVSCIWPVPSAFMT
jgi:hypothetical protein